MEMESRRIHSNRLSRTWIASKSQYVVQAVWLVVWYNNFHYYRIDIETINHVIAPVKVKQLDIDGYKITWNHYDMTLYLIIIYEHIHLINLVFDHYDGILACS